MLCLEEILISPLLSSGYIIGIPNWIYPYPYPIGIIPLLAYDWIGHPAAFGPWALGPGPISITAEHMCMMNDALSRPGQGFHIGYECNGGMSPG